MCLLTRKQLKVVVSMHHVFVKKEAFQKLQCQCIMCLLKRKQFKSCGVDASCLSTSKQFTSCARGVNALCVR